MSEPAVSVILPTYNEAGNIRRLIEVLSRSLAGWDFEILVVDDDSPDGTWKVVQEMMEAHPGLRLLHRKDTRGLTSAFNEGIAASRGGILAWMDCDFSHPPELLPDMLKKLEGDVDAVVASRFVSGGRDARGGSYRLQRWLSQVLVQFSRCFVGLGVLDITSGYIAVRRTCLEPLTPLRGDYGEYFIDLVDRLEQSRCRILEVPYVFIDREFGESKTATNTWGLVRRGVKYLKVLYKVHRKRKNP